MTPGALASVGPVVLVLSAARVASLRALYEV